MRKLEREAASGNKEAALRLVLGMKQRAGLPINDDDLLLMLMSFGVEDALAKGTPCELAYKEKWFEDQLNNLYDGTIKEWAYDGDPGRITGYDLGGPRWRHTSFQFLLNGVFTEDDEEDGYQKANELYDYLTSFETELASRYGIILADDSWDMEVEVEGILEEWMEEEEIEPEEVEISFGFWNSLGPHHILAVLENLGHDISQIEIPDREF
jgi:hypothetical protein